MSEQSSWVNNVPPKTMFVGGLVGGVLVLCAIGFFILLGVTLKGGDTAVAGTDAKVAAPTPIDQPAEPEFKKPPELSADDHVLGASGAKVTLIEYTDFQCPFCQRYQPTAEKLVSDYAGKVKLALRYFPLSSIHPMAQKSAEAAECVASLKGNDAFWRYVGSLFNNQENLSNDLVIKEAIKIGVAKGAMTDCLQSGKFAGKIQQMQAGGEAAGVQGTPATFVIAADGSFEVVPGALPYEAVRAYVERALKK